MLQKKLLSLDSAFKVCGHMKEVFDSIVPIPERKGVRRNVRQHPRQKSPIWHQAEVGEVGTAGAL